MILEIQQNPINKQKLANKIGNKIQTLFLLTASKIIANIKIEIPLSISKFMSLIEMSF